MTNFYQLLRTWVLPVALTACSLCSIGQPAPPADVPQWTTYELRFASEKRYPNPYTDQDVWVWFVNSRGDSLVRPAFWDGGQTWKVRFAAPDTGRIWNWRSYATVADQGLAGKTGKLRSVPYRGTNNLLKHGLLRMSAGKRNVVHADGTPLLVVADTPWSLPFRATTDQAVTYAKDRQQKGFNTALLLSVQPDKGARGPEARNTVLGFDRAFADLSDGHMRQLKPDYYQTLDSLVQILLAHELVAVFAPVAHGYGWKGETAIGSGVSADEYARYSTYLVARYGSGPALWLINLDSNAKAPGIKPAGQAIQQWDAYHQPLGLHYSPYDDFLATWAAGDSSCCFHYNRTHQQEPWLDFQWAQTGHDGLHLYHKVERMYNNTPTKASMNGEPTYEGMQEGKAGLGWWQGEDAWNQLMHGGTMGVVYGAACLWQWKITPDEPGWPEWTNAPMSWRQALALTGSTYVGAIARAFRGYDFADMERRWDLTDDNQPLLAKEGVFYIAYRQTGGTVRIRNVPAGLPYVWFNPVTGAVEPERTTRADGPFAAPDKNPWVLIIGKRS